MKKLTTLFLCTLVCLGLISCTTVLEAGSTYHFSISGVSDTHEKAFTLQKITNKLTLSDHVLSTYFNGLTEDPKNFYLDKKGNIHFIFGQYEVAPYSSGIIDINMGKQAK